MLIPCEEKASDVFRRLFIQGTPEEVAVQVRKLELGQSILDTVAGQAKDLQHNIGPKDRDRLDQYFTSVRDLEQRLRMLRDWEDKPKPTVTSAPPLDPTDPRIYAESKADV